MDSEDEEVDVEAMYQPNKRVKTGSVGGAMAASAVGDSAKADGAAADGAAVDGAPGIS